MKKMLLTRSLFAVALLAPAAVTAQFKLADFDGTNLWLVSGDTRIAATIGSYPNPFGDTAFTGNQMRITTAPTATNASHFVPVLLRPLDGGDPTNLPARLAARAADPVFNALQTLQTIEFNRFSLATDGNTGWGMNNFIVFQTDAAPGLGFYTVPGSARYLSPDGSPNATERFYSFDFSQDATVASGLAAWAAGAGSFFNFWIIQQGPDGLGNSSTIYYDNFVLVPEPSTYAVLLGAAVLGLVLVRRRMRR
jgi:hypothetical protein